MVSVELCGIGRLTIQILAVPNSTSITKIKESLIDITADGKMRFLGYKK